MKIKTLLFVFMVCLAINVSAQTTFVTPSAPKFTDAERQKELAVRRENVFEKMPANSVMMLLSAQPKIYTNDVDFLYRQENNLFYLTSLKQPNAILVLIKNGTNKQEVLFLPKRDPQNEAWNGKMYSNEDASRISGIKTILDANEFESFALAIRDKKPFKSKDGNFSVENESLFSSARLNQAKLLMLLPENEGDSDGLREFAGEVKFVESWKASLAGRNSSRGYKVENAQPIFAELRLIKSPYEIKILQHAIDITTEAQMRAMATSKQVSWEYETQAEIEYIFRKRNADYWGYPSIVGCGMNATTLHYVESQGEVKQGNLLLMDVGAEYEHYTADVTRTFPVNGKFTKEQAEIYQIVYDAQESAAATIKPGNSFSKSSSAAAEIAKQGLAKLGLITAPDATIQMSFNGQPFNRPQYTLFYLHGWGHWLGMNVHDVGSYSTPYKVGMVTTNEPGIYIREDALNYIPDTEANKEILAKIRPIYEKYKGIGVRIEDDMLVTETGVEWMTKKLPRKIDEVEAFMKGK